MKLWRALILILILSTSLSYAQEQDSIEKPFTFSKVDQNLLTEAELLEQQFNKKGMIYHDPELETYLEKIAGPLIEKTGQPDQVQWEFHVLRDPMVNAFALPNGSIYFNSGLLALLDNESQLVGVMAHEMIHVTNRHSYLFNRSVRKKMVAMHILAAAGSVGGYMPSGSVFGLSLQLASSVSQAVMTSMIYGYSREQERDADKIGLKYMADSNYDPHSMPRTFSLLDEKLEIEPIETFYRTHPKLEERTKYTTTMADEYKLSDVRQTPTNDYLEHMANVIQYNVRADMNSRRYRTAVARASRLTNWKNNDPVFMTLLADAYQALGARTVVPGEKEQTRRGQSDARKLLFNKTAEEEEKELISTADGKQTAESNRTKAEQLYRDALSQNPNIAEPHRGLGMLFEENAKYTEASEEYKEYLRLAPEAKDHLRIERRLEAIERRLSLR
jgi:beta-barrel assembly-enhancing protease